MLAVEVAGKDGPPQLQLDKAAWYIRHGVEVVWVLVPRTRRAIVVTVKGVSSWASATASRHLSLPGLEPLVDDLFRQIRRA